SSQSSPSNSWITNTCRTITRGRSDQNRPVELMWFSPSHSDEVHFVFQHCFISFLLSDPVASGPDIAGGVVGVPLTHRVDTGHRPARRALDPLRTGLLLRGRAKVLHPALHGLVAVPVGRDRIPVRPPRDGGRLAPDETAAPVPVLTRLVADPVVLPAHRSSH